MKFFVRAASVAAFLLSANTAFAASDTISFNANATVVSDYRFRGLSYSDKDPAFQGDVSASIGNFQVGAWASSLSHKTTGADAEIDLFAFYTVPLNDKFSVTLGGIAYLYAGTENGGYNYGELYSSFDYSAGPLSTGVSFSYVPEQDNTGDQDDSYVNIYSSYSILPELSFNAAVGYEDGAFADDKWDWSTGFAYSWDRLTFTVDYIDTNKSRFSQASSTVVAGISASF